MKTQDLLDNKSRAQTAWWALAITLGYTVVNLILVILEIDLLTDFEAGIEISEGRAEMNDLLVGISAIAGLGLLIYTAVVFVRWMDRAHTNYKRAGGSSLYSTSAVRWAFFIPILNLFRPYQIVNEFFQGMQRVVDDLQDRVGDLGATLIAWWWFFWIAANILSQISWRMIRNAAPDDIEMYLTSDYIDVGIGFLEIAGALLLMRIIKQYSSLEEQYQMYGIIDRIDQEVPEDDNPQFGIS